MSYAENWEKICDIAENIPLPSKEDTLILFGGGLFGSLAASELKDELHFAAICDNDPNKQGNTIEGLPCISPQKLEEYQNVFVFVSTVKHYKNIHQQLDEMKIRHCCLDAYVVKQNFDAIEAVLQSLDDVSKDVYSGILLCRVSGDLTDAEKYCCDNQYFCLPQFRYLEQEKGAFIDCGAFVGDTLEKIIENTLGNARKIYAFEPNEKTYRALQKRVKFLCDIWAMEPNQIICEQKGVGAKHEVLSFRSTCTDLSGMSLTHGTGVNKVEVISLDEYFSEKQENISFLKADIEGIEWDMLHGAEKIIQRNKPKMAICIYHNILEFFRIPLYLKKLVPEYKFAIRHHSNIDQETVLYCYI